MGYWTRSTIIRNVIGLLLSPFVIYALFRWFEYSQVFQPSRRMNAAGADLGRSWEEVFFPSRDGTPLNGWFFPAEQTSKSPQRAILICHGNAGNITHRLLTCRTLLDLGAAVFVFDYRGYGRSAGRPSEEGTYRDAEAACDWLCDKGFAQTNIVVFGESLGGAVATELALRRPVEGLILVSTFTSIVDLGTELFPWLPVKRLCTIRYETLSKLPRLHVPLLIMHSRADTLIGYTHSERLFAAANTPKMCWELSGDHNDTWLVAGGKCQQGIRRFLESLRPAPPLNAL